MKRMENPANTELRNVTYRLRPGTQDGAAALLRLAGACRFTWNTFLGRQRDAWKAHLADPDNVPKPKAPTFFGMGVEFTKLRNDPEHAWLKDLPRFPVVHVLKDLALAHREFLKGKRRRPRFKSRHRATPTFTIPVFSDAQRRRIHAGKLPIPKLGEFTLEGRGGNPHPDGEARKAVVKRVAGKWYAIVCYRIPAPERNGNGVAMGIDRNVGNVACVTDEGGVEIVAAPNASRTLTQIGRLQRRLSRQVKGSNRRRKTIRRLQRKYRKLAGIRKDWQHRTTRRIAETAETVTLENLKTAAMTRSAKGTVEKPGRNVRAKAGLNRGILNMGWSGFLRKLQYKAAEVVLVDPAWTSQTCSACGNVDRRSRKGRAFKCVACGHVEHAHVNAARNILASGLGASARREAFA